MSITLTALPSYLINYFQGLTKQTVGKKVID